MLRSLYTAASGMRVQQTNVDVIANNLANVNTSGYKRTQVDFQDLMYVIQREPGARSTTGFSTPSGVQIGSGAEVLSTTKVFSPGVLEPTGRELDFAIQGDGFFVVDHPNGQPAYTRDGALRIDATGALTTAQGYRLAGGLTISPDSLRISVSGDGVLSETSSDGSIQEVGQIQLARFANAPGLRSAGGNMLLATESSGTATLGTPGQAGIGQVTNGELERSNVDVVNELVSLITAQRAYEVNSRAIRVGDEMLSEANGLVR